MLPIRKYEIKGTSMFPTLKAGEVVLASPLPYLFIKPNVNDIVVCLNPQDKHVIIKRIQAIKEKRFFVVGDNYKESTDSRSFGYIARKDIIGKIIYKLKTES